MSTSLFAQITLSVNDLPKENDMQVSVVIDSLQSEAIEAGVLILPKISIQFFGLTLRILQNFNNFLYLNLQ